MTAPRPDPREPVVVRSDYGLPYSKGLMAQSIMATGLPPARSFELARQVEARLGSLAQAEVGVEDLRQVAEEVLLAEEDAAVVSRFRQWWTPAPPRPAAGDPARRRHRRREIDGRDPARHPARDHARDRDGPDPSGRAGILLAGVHAGGSPLVLRRLAGPGAAAARSRGRRRGLPPAGPRHRARHRCAGRARGVRALADRDRGRPRAAAHSEPAAAGAGRDGARPAGGQRRACAPGALRGARGCRLRGPPPVIWRHSTACARYRTIWCSRRQNRAYP